MQNGQQVRQAGQTGQNGEGVESTAVDATSLVQPLADGGIALDSLLDTTPGGDDARQDGMATRIARINALLDGAAAVPGRELTPLEDGPDADPQLAEAEEDDEVTLEASAVDIAAIAESDLSGVSLDDPVRMY